MTVELGTAIEWSFDEMRIALGSHLSGRTFFNFLGDSDDPRRAFSEDALRRLQKAKQGNDPQGVIRSNRPVLRDLTDDSLG